MLKNGCKAKRIDVEQGSSDWLQLRRKHVCASDSLVIMGLSPWLTRQELLEQKRGERAAQLVNFAMQRGTVLEPEARCLAEKMLDTLFIPEVYVSEEYPFMLASYDGISLDEKIILEIKCTNKKNHELARNGKIPDYYRPQLQHQMSVFGSEQVYYFSYNGSEGICVIEYRDETYIKNMIELEKIFYEEMIWK
jgi:putative phage-type endonuclease